MTRSRGNVVRVLVALTATAALAASCGGDDDDSEASASTTETTSEAGDTVAITAIDYSFIDLPESLVAGSIVSMHNDSEAELHELVAFRLPDDETRSVEELMALPEAELEALFAGEPAMVLLAPPGEDALPAVGDGTFAEPGRYVVLCAIPQGADPEEYLAAAESSEGPPQVEGGAPHFTLGMVAEVTVE